MELVDSSYEGWWFFCVKVGWEELKWVEVATQMELQDINLKVIGPIS